MKYFVTIDEREQAIDVQVRPTGELVVSIDDQPVEHDVIVLADGALSIRINGKVLDLTVEGTPPDVGVVASGHRAYVRVESERHRAAAAARRTGSSANEKAILAPMPGRVAKVLVNVGDEIKQGQGVIVIEAMKMENELRAKGPGTVAEIHVKAGEAIEAGARLVTFS